MNDLYDSESGVWQYRIPLILTASFILCFLLWAGLSEIPQQVHGTGRIIPSGKPRTIQHLEGGIVSEINVREGDIVEEGQPLFYVKNQGAKSALQELQVSQEANNIRLARLKAELAGEPTFTVPEELLGRNRAIYNSELQLFQSRTEAWRTKLEGLDQSLNQKRFKLAESIQTRDNLSNELDIAQEQLDIREKLKKTGAVSHSDYLETKSRVYNLITRMKQIQNEIPATQAERDEILANIEQEKQDIRSKILEELSETELDIQKTSERITAIEDEVDRMVVASPIHGIVTELTVNTIGEVVQKGEQLAQVVPLEEKLVVEGRIQTKDRGKIWPGLPVVAKISAYDYTIYGGISGVLSSISPDSVIDSTNNQEYYRIRIVLDRDQFRDDKPVHPGMTVDINILTEKVSILHTILRPLLSIRNNALRDS